MSSTRRRLLVLAVLAAGGLFASGCALTGQILNTIGAAFDIVRIWA